MAAERINYQSGFGNTFATEAVEGALPVGRNSPQRPPKGLYPEVLSGTAFTSPRAENRSTWLYRLRPSAMHGPYRRLKDGLLRSGPFTEVETPPNRLRWDPLPMPSPCSRAYSSRLPFPLIPGPASRQALTSWQAWTTVPACRIHST